MLAPCCCWFFNHTLAPSTGQGQQQPSYSYILAPQGLGSGDAVVSGPQASIRPGNTLSLKVTQRGQLNGGRGWELKGSTRMTGARGESVIIMTQLAWGACLLVLFPCL